MTERSMFTSTVQTDDSKLTSFAYPYEEIYHEEYVECEVNLLRCAMRPLLTRLNFPSKTKYNTH